MKHIKKLLNEQKYIKALSELEKVPESDNNFYESLILKADIYLSLEKWEKALNIANEELKMPYIPKGYEELFESIRKKALSNITKKKGIRLVSEDELEKALFRENDLVLINKLLMEIRKLNLNSYLNLLEKYLIFKNGDDLIKTTILFMFKENNVTKTIELIRGEEKFTIQPNTLQNTDQLKCFVHGTKMLEKKFFQEVSKANLAKKMYFTKLYKLTPKTLTNMEVEYMVEKIFKEVEELFE